jgi:hypothetical protein
MNPPNKTPMSYEHKAALACGCAEGHKVRAYIEALESHRPKRGRKRTTETIKNKLAKVIADLDEAVGMEPPRPAADSPSGALPRAASSPRAFSTSSGQTGV